ncbi:ORF MSV090 putative Molluscum contagiosum virus MC121L (vaccinia A16L) homolog, similar to GB:U60315 [Melanoplus sanguinipes entomopoxvirus]|uniref:ORF MSV090 putative Molluscum contagiosum virus MC121L (Vaccinia A16L) homolog, similar to GB:U60315 n=1 Tax=Melanoplus sanguinipes entomopoxvirus TaxID=83191 RepID=Q9YW02_MSEPV|nr:ORF MSV090 putative Molluscum contagiosum virus MC121L (vaccinia A16L) homolog, similar to GB:U60315 [Melanoplus sanguinipes entomopoxvirus]AAC97640.1 ORF MSV090 putative Molluscum contagiosum virus MC121L (vaccinia A16L) homolog, similar to GB:U60315 [Melanoplus sanguinipes entomopoxvirus 'O']
MGGSVAINFLGTSNDNANGNKDLIIGLTDGSRIRLKMYEQINTINPSEYAGKDEYEIEYCMASPYNGLGECAKLFNTDSSTTYAKELDNYIITNEGSSCMSLAFRPGSVLYETSDWIKDRIFNGNKCKIIYNGPPIYENDLLECCTGKRTENCNEKLINNFTTSHCNVTMQSYCENNPNDIYCYRWLESQTKLNNDIALKLYANLCSKNHIEEYCTYFCINSRNSDYPGYCDIALENYCKNNYYNESCYCYNPPSNIIPNVESVLGPKECWLDPCTTNYTNQKWLTTDQLSIKKSCAIQSCIITIAALNASGNSTINLINNCVEGASSSTEVQSQYISNKTIPVIQTWGSLFDPSLFIIFLALLFLILLMLLNYKPVLSL